MPAPFHILERIKKLLALAKSDNEHEADSASQSARGLMETYGVHESDVTPPPPPVMRVLEGLTDIHREKLSHVVARSRRCGAVTDKAGHIAIRGPAAAVDDAAELFGALIEAGKCSELLPGAPELAQRVYKQIFWVSYVTTITERMPMPKATTEEMRESIRDEKKKRGSIDAMTDAAAEAFEEEKKERAAASLAEADRRLRQAQEQMVADEEDLLLEAELTYGAENAYRIVENLRSKAKANGQRTGGLVPLPEWVPPPPPPARRTVVRGLLSSAGGRR